MPKYHPSKLLFTDDYEKNKFFIDLEESFSIIVKNNNIDIKEVLETADDNDVGYIVECDLTFPH